MSARIAEAAALSLSSFRKRYRSSYETSSSSSLALATRKRYWGTYELILDTKTKDKSSDSDDEGHGLDNEEDEEAAPEGQQQAVMVVDIAMNEPLGLGYGVARLRALESTEEIAPSTYETPPSLEWSPSSLPVSPSSLVVPSPIASPVASPAATISRLDALPPTLFEGYDKDLKELYTRPVLALEAWACQTDAQRAALWHAIYDIQRENHDLRMQIPRRGLSDWS
nr:hypothetical protein [Tanacetum cinerariifolium]